MRAFTGTARLTRLALRRDRVQLPIWILGTTVMLSVTISSVKSQFPTEAERVRILGAAVDSPALLMLRTAPTGAGLGAMTTFQAITFLAVLAGFMSTLAVVRHTRQNEETGRAEMIGATVVGRHAALTAAMVVTAVANVVLAVLLALVLIGAGEPAAGSFAFGASVGAAGLAFAAVAAVAAQLTQAARTANGIAASAIGVAYLVRGFGDALGEVHPDGWTMTSAWPSWLSPIGWTTLVRPFDSDRWWVLALPLALFVGGVALAFALTLRRDVGMGMIAARPGPPAGAPRLLSPLGLAWRLQRGTLLGWAVAIAVFGAAIGSLADTAGKAFSDNPGAAKTIDKLSQGAGGTQVDAFFAAMMGIIGALVAGYVVQALLRLRSEEAGGRAEELLATAVGRLRWLASHAIVAVAGLVALLAIAGVSIGLVAGIAGGDVAGTVGDLTGAAFVQLPAALVLSGFAVAVFGLLPRLAIGLAWAAVTVSLVLGQLGDLLNLPQGMQDISPFSHVPAAPAADVTAAPLLTLVAVAVAFGVAGAAIFRRRDVAP
jgi:ABC-2 type transport system permease protein